MAAREPDADTVKADMEQIRTDMATLKEHLMAMGKGRLARARNEGEAALEDIRADLEGLAQDLQRDGRQAVAGLERSVREQPLLSLLAAFGIGMLISQFFGRGR